MDQHFGAVGGVRLKVIDHVLNKSINLEDLKLLGMGQAVYKGLLRLSSRLRKESSLRTRG